MSGINILIDKLYACQNDRKTFENVLIKFIDVCVQQSKATRTSKKKDDGAGAVTTIPKKKRVSKKQVENKVGAPQLPALEKNVDENKVGSIPETHEDAKGSGSKLYHQFRKQVALIGFNSMACVKMWSMCAMSKKSSITQEMADANMKRWNELIVQFNQNNDRDIFLKPFGLVPAEHYNTVKRTYKMRNSASNKAETSTAAAPKHQPKPSTPVADEEEDTEDGGADDADEDEADEE